MTSFKKTAILHIVLSLATSLFLLLGVVLGILKLTEIGMGPDVPWSAVAGAFGVGIGLAIGTVYNMFKAVEG